MVCVLKLVIKNDIIINLKVFVESLIELGVFKKNVCFIYC